MRKLINVLVFILLFLLITAVACRGAVNTIKNLAEEKNQEKTILVQQRVHETFALLEALSEDDFIRSPNISYVDKAAYLTNINKQESLGYMMLRILDKDVNIYREDIGLASNLSSRDYMQRLYSTGERQVTDAFLAGADGKTINYTVAVAIKEDGKVIGALMAAIYGKEIDDYLFDERTENVLVGSELQYMGGISKEKFGLSVAQVLEAEHKTSRPVENILLDFREKKNGEFWGLDWNPQYFVYSPIEETEGVILTSLPIFPLVQNILIWYICSILALLAAYIILIYKKKRKYVEKTNCNE